MGPEIVIPSLGIMTGIIVPIAVFVWLYLESKDKNKTILEISKNIDDPSKLEDLVGLLDERKKEPIDYSVKLAKIWQKLGKKKKKANQLKTDLKVVKAG